MLILAHTYQARYLPRRVNVDARATIYGLEPKHTIVKAVSKISQPIGLRRPQYLSIKQYPRILALVRRRCAGKLNEA